MFGIFTEGKPVIAYNELSQFAFIVIDDFKERLCIPVSYWSMDDYKKSWKAALKEGLEKKTHAVLAVSMYDIKYLNFISSWVIFFENDMAVLQNRMIIMEQWPGFSPDRINDFTYPRHDEDDEEGSAVSEWCTDLDSIIEFYNTL